MLRDVLSMQAIFRRWPLFAGARATRQEIVLNSFAVPSRAAPNRKKKEFGLLEHSQRRGAGECMPQSDSRDSFAAAKFKNVSKMV